MSFIPRQKIFCSSSMGRSSALMTKMVKAAYGSTHEIVVGCANTGEELEASLLFQHRCDLHFDFNTVWLEAVVNPIHRQGTTHRVVTFETASRNSEPFEDAIKKYGIPNRSYPHCTRELKLNPMTSYLRSIGWMPGDYTVAIGLRADEMDRVDPKWKDKGLWYPLLDAGVKKGHVITHWSQQPFDLELEEHEGNCRVCWKKALRKLLTLAKYRAERFDFFDRMGREHEHSGAGIGPRKFFRNKMDVQDIFARSKLPFIEFTGQPIQFEMFDPELDTEEGCGESCEIGTDENSWESVL